MSVKWIKNFVEVGGVGATGGQPSELELKELASAGYEVVINLGLLDPKYCLRDEAGLVADLGMEYHHIPVVFTDPMPDDFRRFVDTMDSHRNDRVFIHCALNWRVSTFVALYGEVRLGWPRSKADAHARKFWEPNDVWLSFARECRMNFPEMALPPASSSGANELHRSSGAPLGCRLFPEEPQEPPPGLFITRKARRTMKTYIGGCLCGNVRYQIAAEPGPSRLCWCKDCQHIASNGTANVLFPSDAIQVSGETRQYVKTADSGNTITRRFCPQCGSQLFADSTGRQGLTVVRLGTLDDPSSIRPSANIWTASAPAWACLDETLERVAGQPAAGSPKK